MSGLEARGISKSYSLGGTLVPVLKELDLDVKEGELVAIMGASGSGKSTLLHVLGCLDRPSGGRYVLGGRDVSELDDAELSRVRSSEIGFVFQKFHLLPQLSVFDNVSIPFLYARSMPEDPDARVREVLEEVGLAHRAHHRPSELSGGEAQRVAIARALLRRPRVLLADEPTGNLDAATGAGILDLLEGIHRAGATVILVTHDVGVAARAGRVLHLRDGRFES